MHVTKTACPLTLFQATVSCEGTPSVHLTYCLPSCLVEGAVMFLSHHGLGKDETLVEGRSEN